MSGVPIFADGRWWLYFYDSAGRLAARTTSLAPDGGWNWRPEPMPEVPDARQR